MEETFDFTSPEDVLIRIIAEDRCFSRAECWKGFSIDGCTIIKSKDGVIGAASYEHEYGGFLDYTLEDMLDCPRQEGFFVVEGITGLYTKGLSWRESPNPTDDDMEFYFENLRPATPEEEAMY